MEIMGLIIFGPEGLSHPFEQDIVHPDLGYECSLPKIHLDDILEDEQNELE